MSDKICFTTSEYTQEINIKMFYRNMRLIGVLTYYQTKDAKEDCIN